LIYIISDILRLKVS